MFQSEIKPHTKQKFKNKSYNKAEQRSRRDALP